MMKPHLPKALSNEASYSVFHSLPGMVFIIDVEKTIWYVNSSVLETLGLSEKVLIGQSLENVLVKEHFQTLIDLTSLQSEYELTLRTRGGKGIAVLLCLKPLPEPIFGQETNYLALAIDMRMNRQVHKELEEQRISQILASRGDDFAVIAGGISHEINTPLETIILGIEQLREILQEEDLSIELAVRLTGYIERSATKIHSLIEHLEDIAQSNGEGAIAVDFSLDEVISEAIVSLNEKAVRGGVKIHYVRQAVPIKVNGHRDKIYEVFVHIIDNAIDAVWNLNERWINVFVSNESELIEAKVIDSGNGIAAHIRNKMFQPFFSTKPIGEGIGIGLSSAKGIIEGHRGALLLDPRSQNTCFNIFLPKRYELTPASPQAKKSLNQVTSVNQSYLFGLNFSGKTLQLLKRACADYEIIFLSRSTVAELKGLMSQVNHSLGVILNITGLSHESLGPILTFVESIEKPVQFACPDEENRLPSKYWPYRVDYTAREGSVRRHLAIFLKQLIPPRFHELIIFAAQSAFESLFPLLKSRWKVSHSSSKYDHVLVCDSLVRNTIAKSVVKLELEQFMSIGLKEESVEHVLDQLSEFLNQLIGIVNCNLNLHEIKTKTGLPFLLKASEYQVGATHFYFPTISITHEDYPLSLEFSLQDSMRHDSILLGSLSFKKFDTDVDFLQT